MEQESGRKDLEMMVLEIKMGTERVYSKLEQLTSSLNRLEGSFNRMDKKVDDLEKKIIVLDQAIPDDLVEKIALVKAGQETHSKILWLLGGGVITSLGKVLADLIMH